MFMFTLKNFPRKGLTLVQVMAKHQTLKQAITWTSDGPAQQYHLAY